MYDKKVLITRTPITTTVLPSHDSNTVIVSGVGIPQILVQCFVSTAFAYLFVEF